MSHSSFRCPACNVTLTPPKPLPVGTRLVCPYCDSRFSLPFELASRSSRSQRVEKGPREIPWADSTPAPERRVSATKTELVSIVGPSDLKKLYGRFAIIMAATVLILTASFATALYFLAKDRAKYQAALAAKSAEAAAETQDRLSLQVTKDKEEEIRHKDFRKHMIQGGVALGNHRFEEAVKEYQESLRLFPDDVDAAKGMSAARTSLENLANAKKEEDKRQAEFNRLVNQGKEAMKSQKFSDAAQAFDNALRLIPENADAAKAYRDAVAAIEAQQLAKKMAADYESHMTAARAAMVGQRYKEARNEFLAALQQKPEDEAALNGRKLADARLNEIQDEDKKRGEFNRFMDQGDRALRNRRYEEAERAYTKAVNLLPRDLDARQGLREAQKGLEKVKQDFLRLVGQGDLAMQSGRFADAVRSFSQANKLVPDDDGASEKLKNAQKALDDLSNAQASYNRLMLQGATAMRLGRFGDASSAYAAALRLAPGDLDALAGLRNARAGAMFGPPWVPAFP